MNKREIIFDIPNKIYGNYRMVCRFGYDYHISTNWWGYLQQEQTVKFWPWSKPKLVWLNIDHCWWIKDKNTMDELKKAAMEFYDEKVEMPERIIAKAMSL